MPLAHDPGHAQVDFGEAKVVVAGVECKAHFFAMDLPQSEGCFLKAYPAEISEAFCDGHVAAFGFFGGVPCSILYDKTTLAGARILGDGTRQGDVPWISATDGVFRSHRPLYGAVITRQLRVPRRRRSAAPRAPG